ncbi:porin [Paraburkholderia tropica]|uniref:porin n=1 Tax=Paraburkholderia tropica TaxID=92647 RepID=UPI001F4133F5|nr:porin [Paraburkholderia tropica]
MTITKRFPKSNRSTVARYATAFLLTLAALPAAHAQVDQSSTVYGLAATGFGPQVFGVAAQRSMVQLYGTVDVGLNYTNAGGRSLTRVQSGNGWTSKFGIYGQEYLGNEWTAFFRLESGITANNGALQDSSTLFNRASFIGIDNPAYGKLILGRTYSTTGTASLAVDPFFANAHESIYTYLASVSDLGYGASADGLNRVNNLITYASPRFAGFFRAGLSYAFKTDQTVGAASHTRGVSLVYDRKQTTIGVSYGQMWCDPGVTDSCTQDTTHQPSVRTDVFIANVQHDFGAFVGDAAFLQLVPRYAGDGIAKVYTVGLQRFANHTLYRVSLAYRDTTIHQDYAYGATLGSDYFLSKRTALYTRIGLIRNGPQSALTYNYDSTAGGSLVGKGHSVVSTTLGMYHNF